MKKEKVEVLSELKVVASNDLQKAVASELKESSKASAEDDVKNKETFNRLVLGTDENS